MGRGALTIGGRRAEQAPAAPASTNFPARFTAGVLPVSLSLSLVSTLLRLWQTLPRSGSVSLA